MKTLLMLTGSWVLFHVGVKLVSMATYEHWWSGLLPAAILYAGIYTLVRSIIREREEES